MKSFKSNKGKLLSSQYLKIIETTPDCVSFKSKIRENKTGPNSETVALNRTPFCSEIVINSTGKAFVSYGIEILAWRSVINDFSSPGIAIPEKSPFISIIKTGIPFCDNCSDNT